MGKTLMYFLSMLSKPYHHNTKTKNIFPLISIATMNKQTSYFRCMLALESRCIPEVLAGVPILGMMPNVVIM